MVKKVLFFCSAFLFILTNAFSQKKLAEIPRADEIPVVNPDAILITNVENVKVNIPLLAGAENYCS